MSDKPSLSASERQTIANDTVDVLLSVKAVMVWQDQPFIYTTGWASPVYVDCRKVMSYPVGRRLLMDHAARLLADRLKEKVNVIAGTESAGIPFASWLAERLDLPMVYVRKKAVGWGINAQIEGDLPDNARCLVVDDLTTDGLSKIGTANALRRAGALVNDIFVVFNYDIYPQSRQAFDSHGINLHALATWRDVFAQTKPRDYFTVEQAQEIKSFLSDPIAWSAHHGGADRLPNVIGPTT